MSVFSKQDYELINLGVCIKNQADRLGIEHDGVPLEGVVVRIAERARSVVAEEPEWEYGYELIESDTRDVLSRGWPFDTAEQAGEAATKRAAEEFDPEYPPLIPQVVRRSKGPWLAAGDWVPVKQEGAET